MSSVNEAVHVRRPGVDEATRDGSQVIFREVWGNNSRFRHLPNGQAISMEKPQGAGRCEYAQEYANDARDMEFTFGYTNRSHTAIEVPKERGWSFERR